MITFTSVVLPLPFGPISRKNPLSGTSMVTPSSATTPPNLLTTSSALSITLPVPYSLGSAMASTGSRREWAPRRLRGRRSPLLKKFVLGFRVVERPGPLSRYLLLASSTAATMIITMTAPMAAVLLARRR